MRYRWTASPERVVFTRIGNRWIFVLVLVVGLAVGSVGTWGTFGHVELSAFVSLFMQMVFAIGALFVAAAIKGLASGDRYDPYEIVFDAARGLVRIRDAGAGPVVEIPFRDIRDFEVRTKSLPAPQGAGRISGGAHYFAVVRTASATFDVVQSASREEPERAIAAMRGCVATSASAGEAMPALPNGLTPANDGTTSTLRWRNAAAGSLIFFLFAASCIGFVVSRFVLIVAKENAGGPAYAVLSFIALVLMFIIGVNMFKFVRDLRTTYELAVGALGLTYSEYPASAPTAPARKVIALSRVDVGRVVFEHRIGEQPIPIRALGPDPAETERVSFDVVALSATERMMLAAWVNCRLFAEPMTFR